MPGISLIFLIAFVVLVILAVFVTLIVFLMLGRGGRSDDADEDQLALDVSALQRKALPPDVAQLQVYGTPVQLMVLVVAPAGRAASAPDKQELPSIVDSLSPGLMSVVSVHQPLFRQWPQQLSTSGFAHAFFNKMSLPGDRGKGTPWCSICGRVTASGRPLLVGLVCAAEVPNALSEVTIEHEGQWMDVLRVKQV